MEIEALDSNDSLLAGRKIQQLQSALKEVEQFHQIDTNTRFCAETISETFAQHPFFSCMRPWFRAFSV
jgi:hypothetical protein